MKVINRLLDVFEPKEVKQMLDENILTPYEKSILKEIAAILSKHRVDVYSSRRICKVIIDKTIELENKHD